MFIGRYPPVRTRSPSLAISAILLSACGAAPSDPAAVNAPATDRNAAEFRAAEEAVAVPANASAQTPVHAPVTDQERDAFGAAVERGDAGALRAIVGPAVLWSDGGRRFERSSPEALIEATRGCRLFEADRIGNDPDMWYLFACPGRPRGAIAAWEEPGVYIKLWHHPAGVLAASYYLGAVQVRRPPPGSIGPPAPPSPPSPPRRPG